jgi:outer membrane protein assembly factor BamA
LNAYYYLTPYTKKSLRFTATAFTKSNNASGGELSFDLVNRNIFKGAEQLVITPHIGLEQQFSGAKYGTRRAGVDVNLNFPRIVSPFNFKTNGGFVPKTKIDIGYEVFSSDTLYTLNSFYANYGYSWHQNLQTEETLNLENIAYVRPTSITPAFESELLEDNTLYRSIEPQLIVGPSYNYNFNTAIKPNRNKNNFYFNGNVDLSGNLIGLVSGANFNKAKITTIANVPVAQYIRLETDFRHYLTIDRDRKIVLASRFWGGIGYAYGNSSSLPYVKAFFAGGTNDIRAFRSRGLGPGSYYMPDTARFLADQPGDIKLEANIELRAKLFSIVNGALFIDAGNVWTLRSDSLRPGAQFSNNFLNQVAVGAGAGLRFDLTILVLRVDVAYPLKKPYDYSLGPSQLVYNLAIGYPF